jgi:hypothetical protein
VLGVTGSIVTTVTRSDNESRRIMNGDVVILTSCASLSWDGSLPPNGFAAQLRATQRRQHVWSMNDSPNSPRAQPNAFLWKRPRPPAAAAC